MPNWVFNTINADTEVIADIKKRFLNKDGNFDFNFIIPMPDALNVTAGGGNSEDIYWYLSNKNTILFGDVVKLPEMSIFNNVFPANPADILARVRTMVENGNEPNYEEGKQLVENYRKFGVTNWYDWRVEHWGTKWNACETDASDNESIRFDTAWDIPLPIYVNLCRMYPNDTIDIYCEEESGWFVELKSVNGELTVLKQGEIEWDEEGETTNYIEKDIGFRL